MEDTDRPSAVIAVIAQNLDDFNDWKKKQGHINCIRDTHKKYLCENKLYVAITAKTDMVSWSFDEIVETEYATKNKQYAEIQLGIKHCLKEVSSIEVEDHAYYLYTHGMRSKWIKCVPREDFKYISDYNLYIDMAKFIIEKRNEMERKQKEPMKIVLESIDPTGLIVDKREILMDRKYRIILTVNDISHMIFENGNKIERLTPEK